MNQALDFINLMSYDMHGTWEAMADHHAPLYKRSWETSTTNNIDYVVKYYISKGFPASKINLGIPVYGQAWTLSTSTKTPPAPASGPASAGPITAQQGFLAYSEICLNVLTKSWTVVRDTNGKMGPYAYSPTSPVQWVGYDDPAFAVVKSNYVLSIGLGGAMVWDISEDDFLNLCGGGANPLLTAISQVMKGSAPPPTTAATTTKSTTTKAASSTTKPSGIT